MHDLRTYLETEFSIVFASDQSYYAVLHDAAFSYTKAQMTNPKADPLQVEQKKDIMAFLDTHASAIIDHTVVVVFVAECALLWGDVVGYSWCPTNERLRLPIGNYKSRQTVYGALNILTGEPIVKALTHANTDATIAFIEMLRGQYANKRIVLLRACSVTKPLKEHHFYHVFDFHTVFDNPRSDEYFSAFDPTKQCR